MKKTIVAVLLCSMGLLSMTGNASAQIAGTSTAVGVAITELKDITMGWSVKKSILGKNLYNENGENVGKIEDLIVSPEKNISYLIVAAGGFIGIGRHDVAIPTAQIREFGGKIVLPGATKAAVQAMPHFSYASDVVRRDRFIAQAEQDITKAKEQLTELQAKSDTAAADVKAKVQQDMTTLKADLKSAEDQLTNMKLASVNRWKQFENGVSKALVKLRQSMQKARA